MKKFGFTLAEVLITLGIIGVVAALTTPAIMNNAGNAKLGPALSKFNNTFSVATELMMERNSISRFHTNRQTLAAEITNLSEFIRMVPFDKTYTFTDALGETSYNIASDPDLLRQIQEMRDAILGDRPNPNGWRIQDLTNLTDQLARNPIVWKLNEGGIIVVVPLGRNFQSVQGGSYRGVVAEVLFDIDGENGANRAGRDVFGFLLDASGTLIPAGSMAHKFVDQSGDRYVTDYSDDCDVNSNNLNKNFACTGKIANNNWSTKGIEID